MRTTLVTIAAAALLLMPMAGLADDEANYPEQVYTGVSPTSDDWLALVSLEGRWAIQVGDGCPTLASGLGLNVLLTGPVESDGAMLVMPDGAPLAAGEACPITAHIWQSAVPTSTSAGTKTPLLFCNDRSACGRHRQVIRTLAAPICAFDDSIKPCPFSSRR